MEGKNLDSGNATNMFLIQLFESLDMSSRPRQAEHMNLGCHKSDKRVLEKAIWRVKWRYFDNFPSIAHKYFQTFWCRRHSLLQDLQDQSDTSHAVSQLEFFFKKKQGFTLWLLNGYFWRPNMERKYFFRESSVCIFWNLLLERFHTHFWSSRSDCRKRCFQNLVLPTFPWLFIRFYLPVKACIITNISRIRFPLAQSCVHLYFNFPKCLFQFICSIESEHINMGSCGQYGNIGYYGPM